jgi:hypothetical protein
MQYQIVFLILPDTVMILSETKCLKLSIKARHCIIFCLLQKTTHEWDMGSTWLLRIHL